MSPKALECVGGAARLERCHRGFGLVERPGLAERPLGRVRGTPLCYLKNPNVTRTHPPSLCRLRQTCFIFQPLFLFPGAEKCIKTCFLRANTYHQVLTKACENTPGWCETICIYGSRQSWQEIGKFRAKTSEKRTRLVRRHTKTDEVSTKTYYANQPKKLV